VPNPSTRRNPDFRRRPERPRHAERPRSWRGPRLPGADREPPCRTMLHPRSEQVTRRAAW